MLKTCDASRGRLRLNRLPRSRRILIIGWVTIQVETLPSELGEALARRTSSGTRPEGQTTTDDLRAVVSLERCQRQRVEECSVLESSEAESLPVGLRQCREELRAAQSRGPQSHPLFWELCIFHDS